MIDTFKEQLNLARERVNMEETRKNIGKGMLAGFGTGIIYGTIYGATQTVDDLPLITLNKVLNCASSSAVQFGYTFAVATGSFTVANQLTQGINNPMARGAVVGATTGAVVGGIGYGWRGSLYGTATGAVAGTALGYFDAKYDYKIFAANK